MFWYIGIVGTINLTILALIALWRSVVFLYSADQDDFKSTQFKKKVIFHTLITLSVISDIPMYVGFIVVEDYVQGLYGLHKLQSAFLFAAYSITIRLLS
jgi:hypothetical protein